MSAPTPAPFQRLVEATNAEDSAAFLACFAADAVLDDWGRRFVGPDAIAGWNARENIGVHSRIAIEGGRQEGAAFVADVRVSGGGYNGGGTFSVEVADDRITLLTIRG